MPPLDAPTESAPAADPGASAAQIDENARLGELMEVIVALARNEFDKRASVGDGSHVLDGISTGVNMLAEEVSRRHKLEQEYKERILQAEKLAALGQLAARVAHEVNNPAAAALANISVLEERLSQVDAFVRTLRSSFTPGSEADCRIAEALLKHDTVSALREMREILSERSTAVQRITTVVNNLKSLIDVPSADSLIPKPGPPPAQARPRVLIVDDEPELLSAYRRLFAKHYDLSLASGGREALEILAGDERWDAILCDVMMPELDGAAVFEWVTANKPALLERLAFCSGGTFTPRSVELARRLEGRLLEKPLSRAQVMAAIESLRPKSTG